MQESDSSGSFRDKEIPIGPDGSGEPTEGPDAVGSSRKVISVTSSPLPGADSPGSNASPNDEVVNQGVAFINETYSETVGTASRKIAQYLLKTFFNNDIELARSHNPRKSVSFRALCNHQDLIPSPASLSNFLKVEVQADFLVKQEVDVACLSYSHQAALIRLPDGPQKLKLAKEAIAKGLSSRRLQERVDEVKQQPGHQQKAIPDLRGNYSKNPFLLLDNPQKMDVVSDADKLKKVSAGIRKGLTKEVLAARERLPRAMVQLDSVLSVLKSVDSSDASTGPPSGEPIIVDVEPVHLTKPAETFRESPSIRLTPALGPYELIIAYIPWEQIGTNAADAATMEDVIRIPIPEVAGDDCVLWLRATNQCLPDAYSVLAPWGFLPKAVLTWMKPNPQPAEWLHDQTEHFILAVKGRAALKPGSKLNSALVASAKTGSRVPVGFYELIEGVYDTDKRLHVFPSIERDGWKSWAPWDAPEIVAEVQREESAAKGSPDGSGKKKGKKAAGTKKAKGETTGEAG